jgi:hypothetical protein
MPIENMLLMIFKMYWASVCTNKKITSSSWPRSFNKKQNMPSASEEEIKRRQKSFWVYETILWKRITLHFRTQANCQEDKIASFSFHRTLIKLSASGSETVYSKLLRAFASAPRNQTCQQFLFVFWAFLQEEQLSQSNFFAEHPSRREKS